jgi:hypothetical protein
MNEWQRKLKYLEKACHSAAMSTTDLTWLHLVRRGGKPATDRLSYGTATEVAYSLDEGGDGRR